MVFYMDDIANRWAAGQTLTISFYHKFFRKFSEDDAMTIKLVGIGGMG